MLSTHVLQTGITKFIIYTAIIKKVYMSKNSKAVTYLFHDEKWSLFVEAGKEESIHIAQNYLKKKKSN